MPGVLNDGRYSVGSVGSVVRMFVVPGGVGRREMEECGS